MPGVVRPTTIVDVLGALNLQNQDQTGDLINGFGDFAETDEQATIADSATVTHQANPAWDAATWGSVVWA
ncbi:hypothetical protein [Streptacidiphilus sp. PAMC 29251]